MNQKFSRWHLSFSFPSKSHSVRMNIAKNKKLLALKKIFLKKIRYGFWLFTVYQTKLSLFVYTHTVKNFVFLCSHPFMYVIRQKIRLNDQLSGESHNILSLSSLFSIALLRDFPFSLLSSVQSSICACELCLCLLNTVY